MNFGGQNTQTPGILGTGFASGGTKPGGFNFSTPTSQTTTPGGFGALGGFGTTAQKTSATATAGGLGFGTTPTAGTAGFSLGTTPATTASSSFGFNANPASTTATTSFGLGGTPATTSTATLGLGGTPANTTASTGFGLGSTPSTSSTLTLGKPTTSAASGTAGFNFGSLAKPAATTTTTGLSLGGTTGFSLGGAPTTTTGGLTLGGGLGQTSTTTSTGLTLGGTSGGLFGNAGGSTGTGLLGTTPATSTAATPSRGLGGVGASTSKGSAGTSSSSGKPSEAKSAKDTPMPNEISTTVEEFKKYVKDQKAVREDIARMTPKPLFKVQEDVATLKKLLAIVSNSLQRNAVTIDKLKYQSAQELQYCEIAQRIKDTPPGLQYENTAPTEYFQKLIEDFQTRMIQYRQQIEEMESHLSSMHQPVMLSPRELSMCLAKFNESFMALAAQLQGIHEAVQQQKEQYLNYRKVFHGDTTDVFEKRRKAGAKTQSAQRVPTTVGPTPFTGITNVAAVAMAAALNNQQPTAAPTLGASSLSSFGTGSTLGSTNTGLGSNLFGNTNTNASGSTGFNLGNKSFGGFGSTPATTQTGLSFGTPNTATVRPLG